MNTTSCPARAKIVPSLPPISPEPRMPMRISEPRPFLEVFGIARALDRDLRGGTVDLTQVVGREPERRGAEVLVQALQLGRAGDRHDPRLLGEQPRERDLGRCCPFGSGNLPQDVHDDLIRLARLSREARHDVAKIRADERRLLIDGARQKTFAEWTERHEPDSELCERRQQFFFGASPPQRVLALDGGDGLYRVGAADGAHARSEERRVGKECRSGWSPYR